MPLPQEKKTQITSLRQKSVNLILCQLNPLSQFDSAVNFARIGTEISKSLLKAVFLIGEQYKEDFYATHKLINKTKTRFSLGDITCLER